MVGGDGKLEVFHYVLHVHVHSSTNDNILLNERDGEKG